MGGAPNPLDNCFSCPEVFDTDQEIYLGNPQYVFALRFMWCSI